MDLDFLLLLYIILFLVSLVVLAALFIRYKKLKRSSTRYFKAIHSANQAIWEWNLVTNKVFFSPEYYQMLGYKPFEFPSSFHTWREMLHPRDLEKAQATLNSFFGSGGESFEIQFRMRTKDGGYKWILGKGHVQEKNSNGEVISLIGTHTDITTLKNTELAVRESEERFKNFFYNNGAPMLMIEPATGGILDANKSACQFYGYTASSIKEMNIQDINVLDDKEVKKQMALAANKHNNRFYFKHQLADGSIRDVEVYSTPFDIDGTCILYSIVHDITDRLKAQVELKESQEKYKLLVDNQTDLVIKVAANGDLLYASPSYSRLFDKKEKELTGTSFVQFIHPEDKGPTLEKLKKIKEPPYSVYTEQRAHTRHGWRWIGWMNTAVKSPSGKITKIIMVGRDITQRKRAEDSLKRSELKYRSLIRNIPQAIYMKNPDLEYVSCNPAFAELLGSTCIEILGLTDSDLYPAETARILHEKDKELLTNHEKEEFEEPIFARGKQRVLFTTRTVVKDDQDKVLGILGIAWDITARKQMEASLIEAEREKSIILDSMSEMVIYYNADFKIKWCSKKVEEIFDTPIPKVIGKDCYQIWCGKGFPCEKCPMEKVMKTQQPQEAEVFGEREQKKWLIRGYPIFDEHGTFIGMVEFALDITERKKAEEIIKQHNLELEAKVDKRTRELVAANVQLQNEIDERIRIEEYLAASESRFRTYIENAPLAVFVADEKGRYTEINTQACHLLGYQKEELLQLSIQKITAGPVAKMQKRFNDLKRTGAVKAELQLIKKNGQLVNVLLNSVKIGDNSYLAFCQDISERILAEQKIKENYEFISTLLDTIPNPIFYKDTGGKYIGCNKAFEKFIGLKKENILGKNVYEINLHETAEYYDVQDKKLLKEGGVQIYESIVHDARGEKREVIFNKAVFQNAKGDISGILGIIIDITSWRKAEEELLKSEKKFRKIIENSPDGIVLADEEGKIIEWNAGMTKITGIRSSKAVGNNIWILQAEMASPKNMHGQSQTKNDIKKYIQETVQSSPANNIFENKIFVHDFTHADGHNRSLQSLIFSIPSKKGNMLVSFNRDITHQKEVEEAIRQSEERLRAIFDNSVQSFFLLDVHGTINTFNKNAYLQGIEFFEKEMKTGDPITGYFAPEFRQEFQLYLNEALSGKNIKKEKSIMFHGTDIWFEYNFAPVHGKNKEVIGILLSSLDITKRKKAETEIYRNLVKEKELNELKSQFISTVSHEFRTPLASIFSNTQLLQRYGEKWDKNKKSRSFNRVFESVNTMSSMLEDVSILGKEQSGKLKFNPKESFPIEILQKITRELFDAFGENNQRIRLNYDQTIGKILIDPALFRHITSNLLSNALKYSATDSLVHVDLAMEEDKLVLKVSDQGIGIPPEDLKNIFKPFYRARNSENIKGTGLGMAIVKKSVDIHNGNISIKSEENKGTEVTVSIQIL